MARKHTFSEVLNNPEGRALVDQIDDVSNSLRAYPNGDATLEAMLVWLTDQLWEKFGFQYVLS